MEVAGEHETTEGERHDPGNAGRHGECGRWSQGGEKNGDICQLLAGSERSEETCQLVGRKRNERLDVVIGGREGKRRGTRGDSQPSHVGSSRQSPGIILGDCQGKS
jgi:hypothetical protein